MSPPADAGGLIQNFGTTRKEGYDEKLTYNFCAGRNAFGRHGRSGPGPGRLEYHYDGGQPGNRGGATFNDCYFWSNTDDGFEGDGMAVRAFNSYWFLNGDYGLSLQYCQSAEIFNCYFGESEVGTQPNGDADIYTRRTNANLNDCKLSSSDDFDPQEAYMQYVRSSNHNQTGSQLIKAWYGDINSDYGTFRTTAPSMQMYCKSTELSTQGMQPLFYAIPIRVTSGSLLTVTAYGKKGSGADEDWRFQPRGRLIGCGVDDKQNWDTADTNWNLATFTGSTARDGVVVLNIEAAGSPSSTFNIDDVTVSLT